MAERVTINEKALRSFGRAEVTQRMQQAMLILQAQVQRKLSIGQPVRRSPSGRQIGLDPSKPGEAPRVLSGNLRKSIATDVSATESEIIGRVGTNAPYGRRLELGFFGTDSKGRNYNQEERPYLRPSLKENFTRLVAIITGGK